MNTNTSPAYRVVTKDHHLRANVQAIGFIIAVIGALIFIPLVAVGAIIIIIGLVIPPAKSHTCSVCGNTVGATSTRCPACHSALRPKPFRLGFLGWILITLMSCFAAVKLHHLLAEPRQHTSFSTAPRKP